MTQQHTKFEFKEFSTDDKYVVASGGDSEDEAMREKDKIINNVIAEHFSSENTVDAELSLEHTIDQNAEGQPENPEPEVPLSIEQVKELSYQSGYDAAKVLYEQKLDSAKQDEALKDLLQQKLEIIGPHVNVPERMCELVSALVGSIAKKLHLVIPADFDSIVLGEMMPLLNKYYKAGTIKLRVHPEKVDYCNNLFRIGSLPEHISKNATIIPDESIASGSCSVEWDDSLLKYDQSELALDVEKILDHFKVKVNN